MKNPAPAEPEPGSSRMPTRSSQTRRKVSPSSVASSSSQRSGIKRRNSQSEAPAPQEGSSYHRSYSRDSGTSGAASTAAAAVAGSSSTSNPQNGVNESSTSGIEPSNGHNNGCEASTTTIIAEQSYESNGSSFYDDAEMEDLSLMPPPRRRKEIVSKAAIEEYKPYLKVLEKSRDLWATIKNIKEIPEALYLKATVSVFIYVFEGCQADGNLEPLETRLVESELNKI